MVGKFVLASVSQNHRIAEAGRNLLDHLTHPQLQQGQLEQVLELEPCVHSGFEYLHGDIHLNRLSHEIKTSLNLWKARHLAGSMGN